jgi:diguanylate cyclase (GGDEF)-like protein
MVAKHIAHAFREVQDFDPSHERDPLTGLPSTKQLEQSLGGGPQTPAPITTSLLFIGISGLSEIEANHGRAIADELIRLVVMETRSGLRIVDTLFRRSSSEFVALLKDTDRASADILASRITNNIRASNLTGRDGSSVRVDVTVTVSCIPQDGRTFGQLLGSAKGRPVNRGEPRQGSSVH